MLGRELICEKSLVNLKVLEIRNCHEDLGRMWSGSEVEGVAEIAWRRL